jgi:hypothetical protein
MDYSGASISQNFGRQGDTATINLVDANYSTGLPPNLNVKPTFTVPNFSQVKLVDLSAAVYYGSVERATLFSGYVATPSIDVQSPTEVTWSLSCVDYSGYANGAIVQATFDGIHMGDAVVYLVKKANCGLQAATVPNGGFVELGPKIPRTLVNYTNLTQGLQKISQMASSADTYGWYVDSSLNLHFFNQKTAHDSGVTVTDTPTSAGFFSFTECHIQQGSLQYEYDGSSVYNRALCIGATRTKTPKASDGPVETFHCDGVTSNWPLKFIPATEAGAQNRLQVTLNGISQTVSEDNGLTAPTTKYTIIQNANGTFSLTVNTKYAKIPAKGSVLKIWYSYKVTVTSIADLKQSQNAIGGPNRGIFSKVVVQPNILKTSAAAQRATRELAEYGHPQERISFTTSPEWVGIFLAGEIFTLDSKLLLDSRRNFAPGLNAKFMITQQSINFRDGGFRTCQVQAIRIL